MASSSLFVGELRNLLSRGLFPVILGVRPLQGGEDYY